MKHFLIEITYTAPLEQVQAHTAAHRQHLQTGYDQGLLLWSGPLSPRTGGRVMARAETREQLEAFLARDPFLLKGVASHTLLEIVPVMYQPLLADWLEGQPVSKPTSSL